jgi:serine/threonine protein kinase/tetratricopeptide (TPR) repeat protein
MTDPRAATPNASSLRKAQVRAALFHKSEPIRIGRFILLEPLGAGAMGEIYAAYDEQLDRKVALKLVRSGSSLTAKADERLLREAQTLAQVSHPNVVQIYEAGTYNGRLFIAMELVRGKTLTSWLRDAVQLPRAVRLREILRQFVAAGRGLEAAHTAGVAHRDFKPDNVLVGDDGRVRVVDFGLARALGEGPGLPAAAEASGEIEGSAAPVAPADIASGPTIVLQPTTPAEPEPFTTGGATIDAPAPAPAPDAGATAKSGASGRDPGASAPRLKAALRLTETGTVMGTPFFMAPEQMRGAIADRRSDQFSFCVALYHALYDAFPFSGRSLNELRDSMESDEVAFASGVPVPAFVRRALHRGLAVEPARRFDRMGELLAALSPRTRRHRGWIAAAGLLAIAGAAALVMRLQAPDPCATAGTGIDSEWTPARRVAMHVAFLRSSLPFAEPAWDGVKARLDDYTRRWHGDAYAACQATHVEHTQSAEQLDRRMLCLDRGRRQLAALVGELGAGAPDAVEHAVEAAGALPELEACGRAENLLFGVAPPPPAVAAEVAKVRDRLAQARTLEQLGRYDESLAIARQVSGSTLQLGYPPVHAEALVQVARALGERSTADTRKEAQKLYFDALTVAEGERHDQLTVEIWTQLVRLATRMDSSMAQAHEWWGQAYAWSRRNAPMLRLPGDDVDNQAELHYLLGEIYYREGEYGKAADEERRAIAAVSTGSAHALELSRYDGALALSLERLDAPDQALQLHERALELATRTLGAGHPEVLTLEIRYGSSLVKTSHLDRARVVLAGALASIPARERDAQLNAAVIHALLSDVECWAGRLDRAEDHGRASLEIYKRTLSPDHVRLADAYINLANVAFKRRRFDQALVLFQDALALRRRHLGNDQDVVGVHEGNIAETLINLDRPDEAIAHLVEAERILTHGSGNKREVRAWLRTVRGEILAGQRRFAAAVPVLEQALTLFSDDDADPTNRGLALWTLARSLRELGRDESRVRALATRAQAVFASLGAVGSYDRDAVARFLDRLPPTDPPRGRTATPP